MIYERQPWPQVRSVRVYKPIQFTSISQSKEMELKVMIDCLWKRLAEIDFRGQFGLSVPDIGE